MMISRIPDRTNPTREPVGHVSHFRILKQPTNRCGNVGGHETARLPTSAWGLGSLIRMFFWRPTIDYWLPLIYSLPFFWAIYNDQTAEVTPNGGLVGIDLGDSSLGGGNSNIFYFHPYLGKMNPFWRAYFSNGLKPPPSYSLPFFTTLLSSYDFGPTMKNQDN